MNMRANSIGRRALWSAELCMEWLGITSHYAKMRRGAVILMYHSITTRSIAPFIDPRLQVSDKTFDEQMRMLAERRNAIGMSDLVARMSGRSLPQRGAVVTFDDAYLDTLTVAAPILEKYKIPAIVYAPTDYVDRRAPQWVDRLHHIFARRTRERVTMLDDSVVDLRNPVAAARARDKLAASLLVARLDVREAIFATLEAQLRPSHPMPRLTMGWDDLRMLKRKHPRFEIGIHTAEHTDMTSRPIGELRDELVRSNDTARVELGETLPHFSFPYSRDDVASQTLVRSLGYASAVTCGADVFVTESSDPFRLPRLDPGANVALLRYWTSGAHPELARAVFGRA